LYILYKIGRFCYIIVPEDKLASAGVQNVVLSGHLFVLKKYGKRHDFAVSLSLEVLFKRVYSCRSENTWLRLKKIETL